MTSFIFLQFFDVFPVFVFFLAFFFFSFFLPFFLSFFLRLGVFTNPLLTLIFFKSSNVKAYALSWMGLLLTCRPLATYAVV